MKKQVIFISCFFMLLVFSVYPISTRSMSEETISTVSSCISVSFPNVQINYLASSYVTLAALICTWRDSHFTRSSPARLSSYGNQQIKS